MREIGFIVRLKVPDAMSADEAQRNLQTTIGFGRPRIRPLYCIDNCLETYLAETDGMQDVRWAPGQPPPL